MRTSAVRFESFAGRDAEVSFIMDRYRSAVSGEGSVVLIGGPAGVGKSRLTEECLRQARAEGAEVGIELCFQYGQAPFGPVADLLRALNALFPEVFEREPVLRSAVAHIAPEFVRTADRQTTSDMRALYAALVEAFRRFGSIRTLALAIEDVHLADFATLGWLQYIVRKLSLESGRSPFRGIFVVTYRSDELHRHHQLVPVLGALGNVPSVYPVDLRPLATTTLRRLGKQAVGTHSVPGRLLEEIVALSEGNPLYAEELLRHVVDHAADKTAVTLPASVQAVVLERFEALSSDDRSALAHAAVIGRRFDAGVLERLTGRSKDAIIDTLQRAIGFQLVVELDHRDGSYEFRHALMRESLYAEFLSPEKVQLHEQVARDLELAPAARRNAVELAHHWWEAGSFATASHYYELAGDAATVAFAHGDAARAYGRAVESNGHDQRREARLYAKLAEERYFIGDLPGALGDVGHAIALHERFGDWESMAQLALRAGVIAQLTGDGDSQEHWIERAIEVTTPHPLSELNYAAVVQIAQMFALRCDQRAGEYLARASAFAGNVPAVYRHRFFIAKALYDFSLGDGDEANRNFEMAIAEEGRLTDPRHAVLRSVFMGFASMDFGTFNEAENVLRAVLAASTDLGSLGLLVRFGIVALAFRRGQLEFARRELEGLFGVSSDVSQPAAGINALAILIALQLEDPDLLGAFEDPRSIDIAFDSRQPFQIVHLAAGFAELYVERGDEDAARTLLRRAAREVQAVGAPWFAPWFARYAALEDAARVGSLLASWASYPSNRAGPALLKLYDAWLAARTGGDSTTPAAEAAGIFGQLGAPYYEAQAFELAGRDDLALAIYERIGDRRDVRRLRIRSNGLAGSRHLRAPNALTNREREVAEQVATGKTNREIARLLVISERTVENHIASIFAKLGIASRTEIVAHMRGDHH